MAQLGLNENDSSGTALSGMNYRWVGTLGHLKVEVVNLEAPSAADYFYSRLANPKGLLARPTSDGGGNDDKACVSLSGKTVTVGTASTGNIGIIIFGL